jgi:hypothetical protein
MRDRPYRMGINESRDDELSFLQDNNVIKRVALLTQGLVQFVFLNALEHPINVSGRTYTEQALGQSFPGRGIYWSDNRAIEDHHRARHGRGYEGRGSVCMGMCVLVSSAPHSLMPVIT